MTIARLSATLRLALGRAIEAAGALNRLTAHAVPPQEQQSDAASQLLAMLSFFNCDAPHPDVLYLGDSVVQRVSRFDTDTRQLNTMVMDRLRGRHRVASITHSAFHPAVYYQLVRLLQHLSHRPRTILLPINMRCFSPQWDLNPMHQCTQHILCVQQYIHERSGSADHCDLLGTDRELSQEDFLQTPVSYPCTSLRYVREFVDIIRSRPITPAARASRLKEIFVYHYMHPLDDNHRKLRLLVRTATLAQEMGVATKLYVTPINYVSGAGHVGCEFTDALARNIRVVRNSLYQGGLADGTPMSSTSGASFCDFSTLLTPESFFHPNDPTEHLNEKGRLLLAKAIADMVLSDGLNG